MPDSDGINQRGQRAALLMVLLNGLSMPMMLSAVNVALPSIAADLAMDAVLLSWVPLAFLISSAALVLSFGRLADMFGRKRMYLIGTAGLIVSSVLATGASSGIELVAYRLLQGVTAAMIYGTHIAIVSSVYPPEERGRVIGLTVAIIYIGLTGGPLVGGWLVGLCGWQTAFLVHVPMCSASLLVGLMWVKAEWRAERPGRFDIVGSILYTISIVTLMVGISSLPQLRSIVLITVGVLGFWLFFHHQHRRTDPLFDVSLFYSNRVFTMSCVASVIMYTATFANLVLISLYLQYLRGMTPAAAGFVLMAQPLVMALVSPYAGKLSDRIEPRVISSFGLGFTALGLLLLASIGVTTSMVLIVLYLMTTGLGFSLFSSPNANAIMGSVGAEQYGIAASSVATMRVIGQVSSMGIVAMAFAGTIGPVQITPEVYPQLEQAITLSLVVAGGLCLPGIYLSLVRGRMRVI
jgi:EmrB/QacA subfamily drug resistance transporter